MCKTILPSQEDHSLFHCHFSLASTT